MGLASDGSAGPTHCDRTFDGWLPRASHGEPVPERESAQISQLSIISGAYFGVIDVVNAPLRSVIQLRT